MISPPMANRLSPQLHRLEGTLCNSCNGMMMSSRSVCGVCSSSDVVHTTFSCLGELIAFTLVTYPAEAFANLPSQPQGLVQLQSGPRVLASICDVDFEDLQIGMRGELVTRRLFEPSGAAMINYGYKFRPFRD